MSMGITYFQAKNHLPSKEVRTEENRFENFNLFRNVCGNQSYQIDLRTAWVAFVVEMNRIGIC